MPFGRKIVNPSLTAALASWRELDQSPGSQEEFEEMVRTLSEEQLEKMFLIRLAFGTAGMRGIMGPGYNCINDVTIQQTSQGYCAYLLDRFGDDAKERGIFIGFDGRHNSENFAQLTAAVFLSKGIRVRLSKKCIATPIIAYAVLKLSCVGGIVITASHNPKEYNGYKIYSETGAQILSPVDSDISAWINQSLTLWKEVEHYFDRKTRRLTGAAENLPLLERLFDSVVDLYIEDIAADLAAPVIVAEEEQHREEESGAPGSVAAALEMKKQREKEEREKEERTAREALKEAATDFQEAADLALLGSTSKGRTATATAVVGKAASAAQAEAAAGANAAATAEYISTQESLSLKERKEGKSKRLRALYTALHGVGTPFIKRIVDAFQFSGEIVYLKEQCTLDPDFSSVGGTPNPEEKGALDMAIREADALGISLIIANDPDADRFAAAEKHEGRWIKFTGNEIGVLLAAYAMKLRETQGIAKEKMAFVASAVSSRMLEKMAKKNDCFYADTLTGFKWMEAKALELCSAGYFPVLLYEEALGYALSSRVRDKDGISAAAVFLQCACALHEEGKTLQDSLLELRRLYGYFCTQNSYFLCSQPQSVKSFFFYITHYPPSPQRDSHQAEEYFTKAGQNTGEEQSGLEGEGGHTTQERRRRTAEQDIQSISSSCQYPQRMGRFKIIRVRDVARQYDSEQENYSCSLPPKEELLSFYFENGAVLTLRGSGTEPKLKYYLEVCASTYHQGNELLTQIVEAFIQHFVKPKENLFLNVPL